jgi:outer membrane protein assembly factor BamB
MRILIRPASMRLLTACFACLAALNSAAIAENWPGWRGPRGDGSSTELSPPMKWNGESGEGIAWKTPIPGRGHGSPIVWADRVFLPTCIKETGDRQLVCLDRGNGKVLWKKTVFRSPLETIHRLNSRASGTPVTDGKMVVVTFLQVDGSLVPAPNVGRTRPITPGRIVVAAYDFSGKQIWKVEVGAFVSAHGFCTSPVLFEDLVIINGDHDGDSYVAALKQSTGELVWKTSRKHKTRSYVTPIIRRVGGRTQMVMSGSKSVISMDPRTGKQHWRVEGPTEQFVASMVFDGELFFLAAGFPTYHVMAIDPSGSGDVTDSHVRWHVKTAQCYVPSPVVLNGHLIVANDRGVGNCFDAKTGERHWQARLGGHFSSSLLSVNGLVYLVADDGETKIIRPGPKFELVATNPIGEYTYASPAISDGQLFIRGENHLYCIGKP